MSHIVLLGDSIFDNGAYVPGGPPVIDQVRMALPSGWEATLLAQDGAVVEWIEKQMLELPESTSHLMISVGGNNALEHSWILSDGDRPAGEAFADLATAYESFAEQYSEMLQAVLAKRVPTGLCTIYNAVPGLSGEERAALAIFNDIILQNGISQGLPILDLRVTCSQPDDYSTVSPIEPSRKGGAKIAQGIARIVTEHPFEAGQAIVYH